MCYRAIHQRDVPVFPAFPKECHMGYGRVDVQVAQRLRFANSEELKDAFLWEKSRRVDKAGCFKLEGKIFEAGLQWVRKTIDIRYDPLDLASVEVWHQGQRQNPAKVLVIPGWTAATVKTDSSLEIKPQESRYLKTLDKKSQSRRERKLGAIAYRHIERNDNNV